jgi:hypothetical protein
MHEEIARDIAHHSHSGQLTRHGSPMTEHVDRVAAAVPDDARAVAFLHDVLEKTDMRVDELRVRGLTPTERAALDLLTRRAGETFARQTLRIGEADGRAGAIARAIKLADLEDHISQNGSTTDPPYRWAHRYIVASRQRRNESFARA